MTQGPRVIKSCVSLRSTHLKALYLLRSYKFLLTKFSLDLHKVGEKSICSIAMAKVGNMNRHSSFEHFPPNKWVLGNRILRAQCQRENGSPLFPQCQS